MTTTAELKQILKEDSNGQNLYDHLTQTLMRIIIDRPKNAYEAFELISASVKGNPLNPDPEHGRPLPMSAQQVSSFSILDLLSLYGFIVGKTVKLGKK